MLPARVSFVVICAAAPVGAAANQGEHFDDDEGYDDYGDDGNDDGPIY